MAVVFGERPDSRTSVRMLLRHRNIVTVSLLAQKREETVNDYFEGATPEALAQALLRPIRKPKAKHARPPERVSPTVTVKPAASAK